MRALLDTQTLIWASTSDRRLPFRVQRILDDESSELVLSVVSAWEITEKVKSGKLSLGANPTTYLTQELRGNGVELLPLELNHVLRADGLSREDGDDFDRLIAAQAIEEGLAVLTGDPVFKEYPVSVLW